jgi:flagellar FliJ protein
MPRFVFKLEGVLDQRRHVEQQRQRDLAEAQLQILTIERQVEEAAASQESASVPLRGQIDPRTLAVQVRFSQVMRQKLSTLRQQLAAAREDLSTAHAALLEASKQRKVLEKLQEKQQARWTEEQKRREAATHEEMNQHAGAENSREDSSDGGSFPFDRT